MSDPFWLQHLKAERRAFEDFLEFLDKLSNDVLKEMASETSNPNYESMCRLQGQKKIVDRIKHSVTIADKEERATSDYLKRVKHG